MRTTSCVKPEMISRMRAHGSLRDHGKGIDRVMERAFTIPGSPMIGSSAVLANIPMEPTKTERWGKPS